MELTLPQSFSMTLVSLRGNFFRSAPGALPRLAGARGRFSRCRGLRRDRLDLDLELGLRERRDDEQRRGRPVAAEESGPDLRESLEVLVLCQKRGDLDH